MIRHTIGRLNHTMKASKIVVAVSVRLPNLFHDFIIKRKISTSVLPPPLKERNPTLVEIAGRMLSVPNDLTKYLEALEELEQKFNLSTTLHNLCMSPNWTPRVHAELILLDLFWSQNLEFVAGDKYIGCSKPACYCCYHCIKAHPGNFAIPACHNNNYLKWRAPDILDSKDYVGIKAREQILIEMTQKIRNDVVAQIMERRGPAKWKPDSMTEISSVRLDTLQISPVNSAAYSSSNPSPDEALDFSEPDSVTGNYGEYETECEAQIDSTGDEDSDGGVLLVNPGPL